MLRLIFVFSLVCFSHYSLASEAADIFLSKSDSNQWKVKFQLQTPTAKLAFIRNPNDARVKRWKSVSDDFVIEYKDKKEFIQRNDNAKFSSVSFILEPTYTPLPKDYAPFSPFSNGGTLLHDGRFFACAKECDHDIDYLWNFELKAPSSDNILVNEVVYHSKANWQSRDSGSNIYIGKQSPVITKGLITLVDSSLPQEIKSALSTTFPKMMNYFISKFGHLKDKHSLFASYDKNNQETFGSQGGTLPKQVFMHWYGQDLEKAVKKDNFVNKTIWFFAHEAAHMYQKEASQTQDDGQAWLHEGAAEKFAFEAMLFVKPRLKEYAQSRIEEFKQACRKGIQDINLSDATDSGQFVLHYSCGFLIHHSIDLVARKRFPKGDGIFDVWREYQKEIRAGAKADQGVYLKIVINYTSKEHGKLIENFIMDSNANFSKLVDLL